MPAQVLRNERPGELEEPTGPSGRDWRIPAFYVVVPLLFAAYGALNNWRFAGSVGPLWAALFYVGNALPPWFLTCSMSTLVMRVLRPWRPRPLVIMLAGHTLACVVVLPYIAWLIGHFGARWPDSGLFPEMADMSGASYWGYWLSAGAVWLAVNLLFDRFLGMPRYRYDTVSRRDLAAGSRADARPPAGRPAFLERAPGAVQLADVIAVKAEQHYIRVVTGAKSYLLLHRFSDALAELRSAEGLQVHRSWWVRREAIRRIRQNARKMSLVLQTGEEIPVSGPYQAMVRQLARESGVPVTAFTETSSSRN